MTANTFGRVLGTTALGVALFGQTERAAAQAPPEPAPAIVEGHHLLDRGHASCNSPHCDRCRSVQEINNAFWYKRRLPQPMILPGSCFGYFQTRWTAWKDVCPESNCAAPAGVSAPPATPDEPTKLTPAVEEMTPPRPAVPPADPVPAPAPAPVPLPPAKSTVTPVQFRQPLPVPARQPITPVVNLRSAIDS
jgi:hypothetical protein